MDGETSPFIEVSGGGVGNSISLSNCVNMAFVYNLLIVIVVLYAIYIMCGSMMKKKNHMSFVEEQIEFLNERQEQNLR
jgi:hypothetical protein